MINKNCHYFVNVLTLIIVSKCFPENAILRFLFVYHVLTRSTLLVSRNYPTTRNPVLVGRFEKTPTIIGKSPVVTSRILMAPGDTVLQTGGRFPIQIMAIVVNFGLD